MVALNIGDRFKSVFTGKVYAVKKIGDRLVFLESDDKLSRVLTERDYLKSFYQAVTYENRQEMAR
jgi:hypothetical protein